jgi:heme O synthase-like polyprenyltransferase
MGAAFLMMVFAVDIATPSSRAIADKLFQLSLLYINVCVILIFICKSMAEDL